jgi:hypothetical protein
MQKATPILLCVNVALAAVLLALVLATVKPAAGITLGEGVVLQQHSLGGPAQPRRSRTQRSSLWHSSAWRQ